MKTKGLSRFLGGLAVVLLAIPAVALAEETSKQELPLTVYVFSKHSYVSSFGDRYLASKDENGGLLTSVHPMASVVHDGDDLRLIYVTDVIRFTQDCRVAQNGVGDGKFGTRDGGFVAQFASGFSLAFPRQELPRPEYSHCVLE